MYIHTDRQTDRPTDQQTDRSTDRPTERQTYIYHLHEAMCQPDNNREIPLFSDTCFSLPAGYCGAGGVCKWDSSDRGTFCVCNVGYTGSRCQGGFLIHQVIVHSPETLYYSSVVVRLLPVAA